MESIRLFFIFFLFIFLGVNSVHAGVVLKVRAVNPLDVEATEVIRYPLPIGIKPDNIKGFRFQDSVKEEKKATEELEEIGTDSKPGEVPTEYEVLYDKEKGLFFIELEVTFAPKGVVNFELDIDDVWNISQARIEELKGSIPEIGAEHSLGSSLKEMILKELEGIVPRQEKSTVIQAGVREHIAAYEKNMKIIEQVEMDIGMLEQLIAEQKTDE